MRPAAQTISTPQNNTSTVKTNSCKGFGLLPKTSLSRPACHRHQKIIRLQNNPSASLTWGKRCGLNSCTSSSNDKHIHKFHNMFCSQYRGWVQYLLHILFGVFLLILFFGLLPKSSTGREAVRTFVFPSKTHPRQAAANATLGVSLLPDQSNPAPRSIPHFHGEHC
jgi:hypothetical protein